MITITNNNIYYSDISIKHLLNLDLAETIDVENIICFLSEPVELGESVTFKRLFEIIASNVDKFNEIYYSTLGGFSLEPFLQEIENNKTEDTSIDFIEIYWACEKYEEEFNIVPSIHGYSVDKDNREYYAIDFISLNNIKNNIVKINEIVEFIELKETDSKNIILGNKTFTLFELFDTILFEISFYGGPLDKKEKFEEIKEISEKVTDEDFDREELVSIEDIMDKIESQDIYLVKYKDLSARVSENRVSNINNLDKLKNCLNEKLVIYDKIQNSDDDLKIYYKNLTDIEYSMQILYGEDEDKSYHRFWETPKCSCPKIDNIEIYPSNSPIFDKKCLIHGE